MIVFPGCKINLGLNVIAKRDDGYHDIETIMYPIPFYDILEALPSGKATTTLQITGHPVPGKTSGNLVLKAYQLLKNDYGLPGVHFHLHKTVPPGSGLGGGSSDAAFTLMILNELFSLRLSKEILSGYAERLGSDCPFFIIVQPALATGRGNVLFPINLHLDYYLVLVIPPIGINTIEAYRAVFPGRKNPPPGIAVGRPVDSWKNLLINDFEKVIFPAHPRLRSIKDEFYDKGAIYASMSGSGSAVYGLFKEIPKLKDQFTGCTFWQGKI